MSKKIIIGSGSLMSLGVVLTTMGANGLMDYLNGIIAEWIPSLSITGIGIGIICVSIWAMTVGVAVEIMNRLLPKDYKMPCKEQEAIKTD